MQRTTAVIVLLCLAPAAVHAEEISTEPPGEMRKHALYEEYWHLWWDKPGFGGPVAWSIIGTAVMGVGAAYGVSMLSDPYHNGSQNGGAAIPPLLIAGGALVLTLAIVWWAKRVSDREVYDVRMRALTDELALRNLPPPGSGD